jgi:hypothetical protein
MGFRVNKANMLIKIVCLDIVTFLKVLMCIKVLQSSENISIVNFKFNVIQYYFRLHTKNVLFVPLYYLTSGHCRRNRCDFIVESAHQRHLPLSNQLVSLKRQKRTYTKFSVWRDPNNSEREAGVWSWDNNYFIQVHRALKTRQNGKQR